MTERKKITVRVHGLQHQKDAVDAAVFAQKLSAVVRALSKADKNVNGGKSLAFLITDLKMGSATATIDERQSHTNKMPRSGISEFQSTLKAIYNGRARELNGSSNLVPMVRALCRGVDKNFSHLETIFDDDASTAIRVDTFFERQVLETVNVIAHSADVERKRLYKGVSLGTFHGTLRALDSRGSIKKAMLTLSASGAEIECVFNESMTPQISATYDRRSVIQARAHYVDTSPIPARLDIISASPSKADPDVLRWKGAFKISTDEGEEW